MSRENVEVVRRLYEAFLRGDQSAIVAGLHPEIEWRSIEDTETRHGHDGVATSVAGWLETWEEHDLKPEEYLDAGDQVVVTTRLRGRGRQSGATVETRYFAVWQLRDGQAVAYREYPSKPVALEAAGLSEQPMSQETVELTYQAYDAFNRRDSAAFLELMDADVEALPRLAAMEGGYHGHDGIRRWWQNLLDAIPDFTVEVVEVRELGDVTLTKMHTSGHGADSDSPLEETVWVPIQWRDKKVVWWGAFATEAEALEAVGLSE
jgi:ketosteroid isomerase-like protein